jgi:L-asparaginase/Glu-tRNA(Gln) amidotransferase subunit D
MTPAVRQRPQRVGLVLTGGTIGSEVSLPASKKLVRLLEEDRSQAPELDLVWRAAPSAEQFEFEVRRPVGLLSEDLVPSDWVPMASTIRSLVSDDGVDAVLILHGTDTMSYTSAALSFMLSDLEVPIVVTGANKPSDQPGTDALQNIRDSLSALRELGPGVFVVFAGRPTAAGRVHLGTRVRKVRASGNAFVSVGKRPVGEVRNGRFVRNWTPAIPTPVPSPAKVDGRVLSLRLYPGLDLASMLDVIRLAKLRGVVLELYPSYTGPTGSSRFSVPRFVDACAAERVPVLATVANEPAGRPNLYESRIALEQAGAEVLHTLPETATVKLMWALGITRKRDALLDLMRTPIANELSYA